MKLLGCPMRRPAITILLPTCVLAAACFESKWPTSAEALRMGDCAECSVEVVEVWASVPKDPHVTDVGVYLETGHSFWTAGGFSGHLITRYNLLSSVSVQYDRRGEGPGEFEDIIAGLLDHSGDTLILADHKRVSFLNKDLEFVRSFNAPVPILNRSMVELQNGDFVFSFQSGQPNARGDLTSLHYVSRDGALLASWDPADGPGGVGKRRLFPSERDGHVWVLSTGYDGFSATLHDARVAAPSRTITVTPEWWRSARKTAIQREMESVGGAAQRDPPDTGAHALIERAGLLWVVIEHAEGRWETADLSVWDPTILFDAVILAIDIETGRPMASIVLNEYALGFSTAGHLVTYELEGEGYPRLRLHEIRLVRGD